MACSPHRRCSAYMAALLAGALFAALLAPQPAAAAPTAATCIKPGLTGCVPDTLRDPTALVGTPCCNVPNGRAVCDNSQKCTFLCFDGFQDCNRNAADGCERPVSNDNANCGACGRTCAAGQSCVDRECICTADETLTACGAACVDITTDPNNCGACGTRCNVGAECLGGVCQPCPRDICVVGGRQTCANFDSDENNCGRCGVRCGANQSCVGGRCSACPAGQRACGECTDTRTDPLNCGACGNVCESGACANGVCVCDATALRCSTKIGALTVISCDDRTSADTCGACNQFCDQDSGAICDGTTRPACRCPGGTAATTCRRTGAAGAVDAGITTTFCASDSNNDACGSCARKCDTSSGAVCAGGQCTCLADGLLACSTGRAVGGVTSFRCIDVTADNNNCGACGRKCTAGRVCSEGVCVCGPGTVDCNGRCTALTATSCGPTCAERIRCPAGLVCSGDGQCVACQTTGLLTDANNCGACGRVCPAGGVPTRTACIDGACACPAFRTDCGAGGCVDTQRDRRNCGGCGVECDANAICRNGECVCDAAQGLRECDGTCSRIANDVNNCGACGTVCRANNVCVNGQCRCGSAECLSECVVGANGARTCSCQCPGGFDTDASGNPRCNARGECLCGGLTCRENEVCNSGRCSCPTGFSTCTTAAGTGCTNVQTDRSNCGSCGNVCPTGTTDTCSGGQCRCGTAAACTLGNTCSGGQCRCGTGPACTAGQMCMNGSCRCTASSACPAGLSCDTATGTCKCGTGATAIAACGTGQFCDATGAVPVCKCNSNAGCPTGNTCNTATGTCQCGSNPACTDGNVCNFALGTCQCGTGATAIAGCATGQTCLPTGGTGGTPICRCGSGPACANGAICVNGTCRCTTDTACNPAGGSTQFCVTSSGECRCGTLALIAQSIPGCTNGNTCTAATANTPPICNCGTGAACVRGNTCVNGACQCGTGTIGITAIAACASTQDCDTNGPFPVCRCTSSAACTNGNSCSAQGVCVCGTNPGCTGANTCDTTGATPVCKCGSGITAIAGCTNGNTCDATTNPAAPVCRCGGAAGCTGSQQCITPPGGTPSCRCSNDASCGAGSTCNTITGLCSCGPFAGCVDGNTCNTATSPFSCRCGTGANSIPACGVNTNTGVATVGTQTCATNPATGAPFCRCTVDAACNGVPGDGSITGGGITGANTANTCNISTGECRCGTAAQILAGTSIPACTNGNQCTAATTPQCQCTTNAVPVANAPCSGFTICSTVANAGCVCSNRAGATACAAGQICSGTTFANAVCTCTASSCTNGNTCSGTTCVCGTGAACTGTNFCLNGICTAACTTNTQLAAPCPCSFTNAAGITTFNTCAVGQVCVSGQCLPPCAVNIALSGNANGCACGTGTNAAACLNGQVCQSGTAGAPTAFNDAAARCLFTCPTTGTTNSNPLIPTTATLCACGTGQCTIASTAVCSSPNCATTPCAAFITTGAITAAGAAPGCTCGAPTAGQPASNTAVLCVGTSVYCDNNPADGARTNQCLPQCTANTVNAAPCVCGTNTAQICRAGTLRCTVTGTAGVCSA